MSLIGRGTVVQFNFRDEAVAYARSLIGTPFHHAARKPGIGVDCVGVIVLTGAHIGAWPDGFDVEPYTEVPDGTSMRRQARQHLRRVHYNDMRAGDVVMVITDRDPQHLGILADYRGTHHRSIIHASNVLQRPRVVETPLLFGRGFKFVEAYSFPMEG